MAQYDLKLLDQLRQKGVGWEAIIKEFYPGTPRGTLSAALARYRAKTNKLEPEPSTRPIGPPVPSIQGETAGDELIDEGDVWRRALAISRRHKQRQAIKDSQLVAFSHGPICIVNFADLHLGGEGVDYDRLDRDLDLVARTPGMYAGLAGDLLDNFIIGKLLAIRMGTPFTVGEEWALVRYALKKISPAMLWSVGGNHDKWSRLLGGIDYFREVQQSVRPDVLYDADELNVTIHVGQAQFRWRVRHKWPGRSQYNPTHAIEKAAKFDGGVPFDVGIGAHTHEAGVARFFNNGAKTGLAVLSGSYKRYDDFARTHGFPKPNEVTAVPVILGQDGSMVSASSIAAAADYMAHVYQPVED